MSLVEVAIAVGLVSFILVSIMGLFPTMLNTVRDSREKALSQRMFQAVAGDLHENPVAAGETREYRFDSEGFLLGITPTRPGQTVRTGEVRFTGSVSNSVAAPVPAGHTSAAIVLSRVELKDVTRKTTLLQRPVWTTSDD